MKTKYKLIPISLTFIILFTFDFQQSFASVASASSTNSNEELNELLEILDEEESFEFIVLEDNRIIYNLENEDGSIHQYVELTKELDDKTIITTEIYDITNEKNLLILIDSFTTEIFQEGNNLLIDQGDEQTVLIDLEPHQSNSNLDSNIDLDQPLEVNNPYSFSTSSTSCSNWTKTRFPGMNLGYCTIYTKYGGNATYSTMRKSNVLRNKDYEDFILNVNKLRDRESAIIGSVSIVEFAKSLMKKRASQWTLAIIKEALKKAALPLTLGYTMFMWIWQYDKTLKNYYRLKTIY